MGWGIFAGSTASTALNTYKDLQENDRQNAQQGLAERNQKNRDAEASREASKYDTEVADEAAVRAGLFGEQAPVSTGPKQAVDSDAPSVLRGSDEAKTALRKTESLAADDAAPARGRGLTTSAKAEPASSKVAGSNYKVPTTSAELYEAARRTRSPKLYEAAVKAGAAEEAQKERLSLQRAREISSRYTASQTTAEDLKNAQAIANKAAQAAAGNIGRFADTPDTTPLSDPKARAIAEEIKGSLMQADEYVLNGQKANLKATDNGYTLSYTDKDTGKEISSREVNTVGELKQITAAAVSATSPEIIGATLIANYTTKNFNELQAEKRTLEKATTENKLLENDLTRDKLTRIKQGQEDLKTFTDITSPDKIMDNLEQAAQLAEKIYQNDTERYGSKVTRKVKDPDTGREESITTTENQLTKYLKAAVPSMDGELKDASGKSVPFNVGDAVRVTADALAKKIADNPKTDAEAAFVDFEKKILGSTLDKRLAPYAAKELRALTEQYHRVYLLQKATPKSSVPQAAAQPSEPAARTVATRGGLRTLPPEPKVPQRVINRAGLNVISP